jgi:hypothetical protein
LVADLDETFRTEKFNISVRIITFLSDLANARVLTLQSVLEFLESFIELTVDENVILFCCCYVLFSFCSCAQISSFMQ